MFCFYRLQSGRNRGPIMDISLSQLDQPATPLLTGHGHSRAPVGLEDEEPLQRPSLPRIDGILLFENFNISSLRH